MGTISTKFYKSHRFPAAIFSLSVWLYFFFHWVLGMKTHDGLFDQNCKLQFSQHFRWFCTLLRHLAREKLDAWLGAWTWFGKHSISALALESVSYILAGLVLSIVFFYIVAMYVAGILVVFYCLTQLDNPSWAWLTIVLVSIAGNFFECAMQFFRITIKQT